jgi:hypothetical protein
LRSSLCWSTWYKLANFVEKLMKMPTNTFNISWRYVAPSRSKMFQVMQSYFFYSHSHYWGEWSNGFTPTKTNLQLGHCVLLPFWQSSFL